MIAAVILSGGLLIAPVNTPSCSMLPQTTYRVDVEILPVRVSADFGLADLSKLASRQLGTLKHPAFGFYAATFGYTIKVHTEPQNAECPGHSGVIVTMILAGRHIEVARELVSRKCLYSAVLQHYLRHAADDAALIEGYRKPVVKALKARSVSALGDGGSPRDLQQKELRQTTAETTDSVLIPLSEERADAAERVDTPAEISRLKNACHDRA